MNYNIVFIMGLLFIMTSCDPFHTNIEEQDTQTYYFESKTKSEIDHSPTTIAVVTWNIKFGGARVDFFFDCYGDRVLMSESEVIDNMAALSLKIRQMNPDVMFLQEADIDSKRSGYVNQVQYILDHTDLNYGVYASQWLADFVPNHGIGQMNSGNAILSKYSLHNAERIALPLISEQDNLSQYFYLRRNILTANITINDNTIELLDTHTSAYSKDGTKETQIQIIKDKIAGIDANGKEFIIGGDFNNIPPETIKYCEYDDDVCPDDSPYKLASCKELERDLKTMEIYLEYDAAIPQDVYLLNQSLYSSYTSNKNGFWNRKLDYIFTNGDFIDSTGMVHQDVSTGGMATMPLSDHAPLSTIYIVK